MDGICKNALLRDGSHTAAAPVRTVRDPHFSKNRVFLPSTYTGPPFSFQGTTLTGDHV